MSDIAIQVENLSKQYKIGVAAYRHDSLRDHLTDWAKSLFHRNGRPLPQSAERLAPSDMIWALKDVSFEVKQGEVVGFIGRNGAGKSTLLKILSRITEPTSGFADIHGRVASLLEVGTGFHGDLTGRENIYLNGAILGMKKAEISRKFDEIVDFSGVERFIDTPVKRYSSGMYVRLAFAVAAHLDPEILIVDEVLSVGDAAFQQKCMGKMQAASGSGRTVLFVSHNLGSVKLLCDRCLLLSQGEVLANGPSDSVIGRYIEEFGQTAKKRPPGRIEPGRGSGFVLHHKGAEDVVTIFCGDPLTLEFDIEAIEFSGKTSVGIQVQIANKMAETLVTMSSLVQPKVMITGASRRWSISCDMGRLPLNAGTYIVNIDVVTLDRDGLRYIAEFSRAMTLRVMDYDVFGWGRSLPSYWGPMYWTPQWDIRPSA